jgi:hypothetical protein
MEDLEQKITNRGKSPRQVYEEYLRQKGRKTPLSASAKGADPKISRSRRFALMKKKLRLLELEII